MRKTRIVKIVNKIFDQTCFTLNASFNNFKNIGHLHLDDFDWTTFSSDGFFSWFRPAALTVNFLVNSRCQILIPDFSAFTIPDSTKYYWSCFLSSSRRSIDQVHNRIFFSVDVCKSSFWKTTNGFVTFKTRRTPPPLRAFDLFFLTHGQKFYHYQMKYRPTRLPGLYVNL